MLFQYGGTGIVALVHPVAEAHQPVRAVAVLGPADELRSVAALRENLLQHGDDRLVRSAVARPPQGRDARADDGVHVGEARAGHAHRRGRAVLLVVGVQDEEEVDGAHDVVVEPVVLHRRGEHHGEEVRNVAQRVGRVDDRLADGLLVGDGRDGAHLRDEVGEDLALRLPVEQLGDRVEGGERGHRGGEDPHGVRPPRESQEEVQHVLVDQRALVQERRELLELALRGQLAVQQQVGDLGERRMLREILDRIPPVAEDAPLAVDERDPAAARTRVLETPVERHVPRGLPQARDVHGLLAFGAAHHGQLVGLPLQDDRRGFPLRGLALRGRGHGTLQLRDCINIRKNEYLSTGCPGGVPIGIPVPRGIPAGILEAVESIMAAGRAS